MSAYDTATRDAKHAGLAFGRQSTGHLASTIEFTGAKLVDFLERKIDELKTRRDSDKNAVADVAQGVVNSNNAEIIEKAPIEYATPSEKDEIISALTSIKESQTDYSFQRRQDIVDTANKLEKDIFGSVERNGIDDIANQLADSVIDRANNLTTDQAIVIEATQYVSTDQLLTPTVDEIVQSVNKDAIDVEIIDDPIRKAPSLSPPLPLPSLSKTENRAESNQEFVNERTDESEIDNITDSQRTVIDTTAAVTSSELPNLDLEAVNESGDINDQLIIQTYPAELFDIYKNGFEITITEKGSTQTLFKFTYDDKKIKVVEDNLTKNPGKNELLKHFKIAHRNINTLKSSQKTTTAGVINRLKTNNNPHETHLILGALAREGTAAIAIAKETTSSTELAKTFPGPHDSQYRVQRQRSAKDDQPDKLTFLQTGKDKEGKPIPPAKQIIAMTRVDGKIESSQSPEDARTNYEYARDILSSVRQEIREREEFEKPKLRGEQER